MKKTWVGRLWVLLGALLICLAAVPVSAEDGDTWYDENFTYTNTSQGVKIVKYDNTSPTDSREVTIPLTTRHNNITYPIKVLGAGAFSNNTDIVTLNVSANVVQIDQECFSGCTNLRNLNLGDRVGILGAYMARGTAITEIKLPTKLAMDQCSYAFTGCENLTKVTVADGSTVVPNLIFYGCTKLKKVTLPKTIKRIGVSSFSGCTVLSSINLPDSIMAIGDYAFSGCASYSGSGGSLTLPKALTSVGTGAFAGTKVQIVTFPAGLESAGSGPFDGCETLQKAYISSGMEAIPSRLLYNCPKLTYVDIPYSVKSVGASAFANCFNLRSIELPDYIEYIGQEAFYGCSSIKTVKLPAALRTLESSAFEETIIESVTIPRYLTTTGSESPFLNCHYLKSASIDEGATVVPARLFYNCVALRNVVIPGTVQTIGASAFSGCIRLENVVLPSGIVAIEDGAFNGCTNISSISLPDTLQSIGVYAFYGTTIKSVTIPAALTTVGSSSPFFASYHLKKAVITSGMTAIPANLFSGCTALTTVTIPKSVKEIGANAFYNCANLKTVNYKGTTAQWEKIAIASGNEALIAPYKEAASNPSFDGTDDDNIENVDFEDAIKEGVYREGGVYYKYVDGENMGVFTGFIRLNGKTFITKGRVSTMTGIVKWNGTRFYLKKGIFQSTYTGLVKYKDIYWYVVKGKVDVKKNGLILYKKKLYFVRNGKWLTSFNGTATYKGKAVKVTGGVALP
ncbi:MAG: leucine-rich repeat domain-containing protein [Lachnospiraceae bacterium]|nr:leucine-rich repeat domain-containing protein [Lachnospiraceae bacterium]